VDMHRGSGNGTTLLALLVSMAALPNRGRSRLERRLAGWDPFCQELGDPIGEQQPPEGCFVGDEIGFKAHPIVHSAQADAGQGGGFAGISSLGSGVDIGPLPKKRGGGAVTKSR
jgi:hypothetical protein